jgi:hypothetical protein
VYLLDDGRTVELAESFTFCDSRGREWTGNKGDRANGTSYPEKLWSLTGGPWSTKSRWGALLHDIYCVRRDRPWQMVHNMFGEVIRVCGVPEARALLEFNAVWRFGPRWNPDGTDIAPLEWDDGIDYDLIGG